MESKAWHVLVIPAWLPSEDNPWAGVFIINHCIAMQQTGKVRMGMIYHGEKAVPRHARDMLESHGIPLTAERGSSFPKAFGWLIDVWCRRYLRAFQSYTGIHGVPDLLHAHSYIAGFAARYIARRTGVPYVLTEHSTALLEERVRWGQRRRLKHVLGEAQRIIAVGSALKDALAQRTRTSIEVIPNPVDKAVFYYDPDVQKEAVFTVIAIGALTPRKRYPLLFGAFAKMENADAQLICVGLGTEEARLKRQSETLGIASRVTWHEQLSPSDIANMMRSAHVLVSVSRAETSGVAVVEALMCGLPVVCTASGGPEEYVSGFQGMILPSDAADTDIAHALDLVYREYGRYEPWRIAQEARTHFDREVIADRVLHCYRAVLEKKNTNS